MTWPVGSVLGEAWRSRRRLVVWAGLPFALLLAGLLVAELTAGTQLWGAEQRRRQAGGDVLTVVNDPPLASAGDCLRLARWPSIRHVGAVGASTADARTGFSVHPDAEAEIVEVTPGALAVLGATAPPVDVRGVVVGRQLADELGLAVGALLDQSGPIGALPVTAIVDTSARFPGRGRVLFRVQPQPSRTQQCLIETVPHARDQVRDALVAVGIATGSGAEVQPLGGGDLGDAVQAYRHRASRYGWLVVAGLTGLSALAATWFSRARCGLYRALGVSRTDLVLMAGVQTAVFVLPAVALAAAGSWAVIAVTDAVTQPAGLWLDVARNVALAGLGTLVVVPLAVLAVAGRSLAGLIRTRL